MSIFRMLHEERGGHTHVRVFAGRGTVSLAMCGNMVFTNEEWVDFIKELNRGQYGGGSIEFVPAMEEK